MKYTNKTGNTASLSWDKFTNLDPKQFVKYQLRIQKKLSSAESPIIKSSSKTSYFVSGLEAATLYDVSVRVMTVDFGGSEYTEEITFKTDVNVDSDKSEVGKLSDTVVSI